MPDRPPIIPFRDSAAEQDEEDRFDSSPNREQDGLALPLLPHRLNPRPATARSSTDPTSAQLLQSYFSSKNGSGSGSLNSCHDPLAGSQRNPSLYSKSHLRSRSTGTAISAPVMTRAHSSPAVHSAPRPFDSNTPSISSLSPGSPYRSPARQRSPYRPPQEDGAYNPPPRSPSWFESPSSGGAIEAIQEDSELDITPRQSAPLPALMPFARSASLRRRPASPLHSVTNASTAMSNPGQSMDNSASSSPFLGPQRYNENYPLLHHYASSSSFSSVPSTPTSQRSRSPSISSLDTIEDVPDLESEAIEAERIERLKFAEERAERREDEDDNPRRRSSLDGPRGFGFGRGVNREKKRWSVCGGERRADLDLETIWED